MNIQDLSETCFVRDIQPNEYVVELTGTPEEWLDHPYTYCSHILKGENEDSGLWLNDCGNYALLEINIDSNTFYKLYNLNK